MGTPLLEAGKNGTRHDAGAVYGMERRLWLASFSMAFPGRRSITPYRLMMHHVLPYISSCVFLQARFFALLPCKVAHVALKHISVCAPTFCLPFSRPVVGNSPTPLQLGCKALQSLATWPLGSLQCPETVGSKHHYPASQIPLCSAFKTTSSRKTTVVAMVS